MNEPLEVTQADLDASEMSWPYTVYGEVPFGGSLKYVVCNRCGAMCPTRDYAFIKHSTWHEDSRS